MNLRQNLMIILGQQEIRHFPSCIVCSFLWSDVAFDHWPTRKLNRVLRRACPVRVEARITPAPASKRPEDREFVVDSGASMHMLSKKDLSSDEMETLVRSGNPTTVVTATGEVQTSEEAQVYVHDLDLFGLHFHHLENLAKKTDIPMSGPAVNNHVWPKEITYVLLTLDCRPSSGTNSSSTSPPQDSSSSSSCTPPSPAAERSDELAPRNWSRDPPKTQNRFQKKKNYKSSDDRFRDLPEWLEEFADNLEGAELPAPAHSSLDTDSKRPMRVASTKHFFYKHFRKDRTCEVCKRTKRTKALCRRRTGETI